jgi:hypothetical protein
MPKAVGPVAQCGARQLDHKNVIATPGHARLRVLSTSVHQPDPFATEDIVLEQFSCLRRQVFSASLSRCGAIRAQTRTQSWRDREAQPQTKFAWSLSRLANRLRSIRRSQTHVWSRWSALWRGEPRGILFKPKWMPGSATAFQSKEAWL